MEKANYPILDDRIICTMKGIARIIIRKKNFFLSEIELTTPTLDGIRTKRSTAFSLFGPRYTLFCMRIAEAFML